MDRGSFRRWVGLAMLAALTGCAAAPEPPVPIAAPATQAAPPQLKQSLDRAALLADPHAIGVLAGGNPQFAVRIVCVAVTAHPNRAADIAAAAAAAEPDQAPALAAAAATANPAAAAEIARKTAAAVPEAGPAIGAAILDALLPDERLVMARQIEAGLHDALPLSVDDWALAASDKR
jgi:hypothetical protein